MKLKLNSAPPWLGRICHKICPHLHKIILWNINVSSNGMVWRGPYSEIRRIQASIFTLRFALVTSGPVFSIASNCRSRLRRSHVCLSVDDSICEESNCLRDVSITGLESVTESLWVVDTSYFFQLVNNSLLVLKGKSIFQSFLRKAHSTNTSEVVQVYIILMLLYY